MVEGSGRPGAVEIARQVWIRRQDFGHQEAPPVVLPGLGAGEAEAIALAVRLGGEMPILLDDRKARRIAHEHGFRIIGGAGLLVVAKERGLIPSVRPLLNELRGAGLYLSNPAERELLAIAGELLDDLGSKSELER